MARKAIEIDFKFLDGLLKCGATKVQCSNILGVSEDTIEKRIKEKYNVTFSKYRDSKLDGIRMTLVQKAMQVAQSGNVTMLIFCLKNLCGWSDKREDTTTVKGEGLVLIRPATKKLE